MKQHLTKRILALLLSLVMILSLFPISALAAERTYDGSEETMYVDMSGGPDFWLQGVEKQVAFFCVSGEQGGEPVVLTQVEGSVYGCTIPTGTWTHVVLLRTPPDDPLNNIWETRYNQTDDIPLEEGKNLIKSFAEGSADATWGTYPNLTNLERAITRAQAVDRTLYTEESLAEMDDALADAIAARGATLQSVVDEAAEALDDAIDALVPKPAEADPIDVYIVDQSDSTLLRYYTWDSTIDKGWKEEWPGEALTKVGNDRDGHPYYKITGLDRNSYDKIIFNKKNDKDDSNNPQTPDMDLLQASGSNNYAVFVISPTYGCDSDEDLWPDDSEHKTVKDPTCTAFGTITWKSLIHEDVDEVDGEPPLGHNWVEDEEQPDPTKIYYHCSRCEATRSEEVELPPEQRLITVYVIDKNNGGFINYYTWKAEAAPGAIPGISVMGMPDVPDAASKAPWPGEAVEPAGKDKNGNDYYAIELDVNAYDMIIFNNIVGGSGSQSGNLALANDVGDGSKVLYTIQNNSFETEAGGKLWVADGADTEPTCTESGKHNYKNLLNEEEKEHEDFGAPFGHDWDEGEVTLAPTVEAEGEMTYHCKREGCTATKTEAIPKLEPTVEPKPIKVYVVDETDAETVNYYAFGAEGELAAWPGTAFGEEKGVNKDGHKYYMVELDGAVYDKIIFSTAEGQTADLTFVTDAGENDWALYYLTKSGANLTASSSDKLWPDDADHKTVTEPSCLEGGKIVWTNFFDEEDTIEEEFGLPLGHDWDEGEVTLAPTVEAEGEMTYHCKREGCTATKVEAIPKLEAPVEPKPIKIYVVDETDAEAVNYFAFGAEGELAPWPGTAFTEELGVNKDAHKFYMVELDSNVYDKIIFSTADGQTADLAFVTDAGENDWVLYYLVKSGANLSASSSDKLWPDDEDHKTVTEPSCLEAGKIVWKNFFNAEDTFEETFGNPLGHEWDEGEVTLAPTVEAEGEMTYHCKREGCTATKVEAIPKLEPVVEPKEITVWVLDKLNSEIPYYYTWNNESQEPKTAWPGDALPGQGQDIDGFNYYKVVIDINAYDRIIFHTALDQTTDLVLEDPGEEKDYIIYVIDEGYAVETGTDIWAGEGETVEPTCVLPGKIVYKGIVAEAVKEVEFGTPLGHDWDEGEVTLAPTVEAEGEMTYHCKREGCTATKVEAIPKLEPVVEPKEINVWVLDKTNSETLNYYTWNNESQEFKAEWPGEAMTAEGQDIDGFNYYKLVIDINAYDKIIFNTGLDQTSDLTLEDPGEEKDYIIFVIGEGFAAEAGTDIFAGEGEEVAPTCTAPGKLVYTGIVAGTKKEVSVGAPAGHEWDEGEVTLEPTLEAEGEMTYHCKNCEATKTEAIPKLEPTVEPKPIKIYVVDETDAETVNYYAFGAEGELAAWPGTAFGEEEGVNKDGHKYYMVELDGAVYDKIIFSTAEGQTADLTFVTDAGENDWVLYYLLKSGASLTASSSDKLWPDDADHKTVTEPSCLEGGKIVWTNFFDEEDTIEEEFGLPLGHDWDEGEVTLEPTLEAEGEMTYHCKREGCTATKVEAIPKLEPVVEPKEINVWVLDKNNSETLNYYTWNNESQEPKAAWPGEAMTAEGQDIDGFNYYKLVIDINAYDKIIFNTGLDQTSDLTLEDPGEEKDYIIFVIGEGFAAEAGTDIFAGEGEEVAPTCTAPGKLVYTGIVAGTKKEVSVGAPAGHEWDEGEVTLEPTTEAEGEMTYTCQRCGETKTEPIPKLEVADEYTIYVVDTAEYGGDLYYYTWNNESQEFKTAWPGELMTAEEEPDIDGQTYYILKIDANKYDRVIFHNNNGQTADLDFTALTVDNEKNVVVYLDSGCKMIESDDAYYLDVWNYRGEWRNPSCEEPGQYKVTGILGGERFENYGTPVGHAWVELSRTEPTVEEEGYILYRCSNCGATRTETIPKLDPTEEPKPIKVYVVDETDAEAVNYYAFGANAELATWPGAAFEAELGVNKEGHKFYMVELDGAVYDKIVFNTADGQTADLAFVTDAGENDWVLYYMYMNGANVAASSSDKLWPDDAEHKTVTEPSCLLAGKIVWKNFFNAEDTIEEEFGNPLGHEWNDGEVTLEPTVEAEGEMTYTCLRCGETKTEAIPKLEPVVEPKPIKIYVVDETDAEALNYYAFGADGELAAWPGTAFAENLGVNKDGHKYYMVELDGNVYDKIIFSTADGQTADLAFVTDAGENDWVLYYVYMNGANVAASSSDKLWPDDADHKTVTEPSCLLAGKIVWKNFFNAEDTIEEEFGNPLGHDWVEIGRTEPQVGVEGAIHYKCSRCGETKDEVIPALEPKLIKVYVVDETDAEALNYYAFGANGELAAWPGTAFAEELGVNKDGHKYYMVEVDGSAFDKIIFNTADGQTADLTFVTDAGENDWVLYYLYMNGANVAASSSDKMWPDDADHKTVTEPTCTEPGKIVWKNFFNEEDTLEETVGAPLGHDWVEIGRTEPQVGVEGAIHYKCSRCGETKDEVIPALESKFYKVYVVDETDADALNYYAFGVNGELAPWPGTAFAEELGVNKDGHKYYMVEVDGAAFDKIIFNTAVGQTADLTFVTDAGENDWVLYYLYMNGANVAASSSDKLWPDDAEHKTVTEPSCLEAGKIVWKNFFNAEDTLEEAFGNPLGHLWNDGEITKPATLTEEGEMTYTCLRCGETKTEPIPMLEAPEPKPIKVYVVDETDAETLNYYAFGEYGELAPWPGTAFAENLGVNKDGHKFYMVELDGALYDNIIFNTADGQTADLAFVTDAGENDWVLYYLYKNGANVAASSSDKLWPDDAEHKTVTEPTCTEPGKIIWKNFFNEEDTLVESVGAPLGHDWDDGVVTLEPTYDAEGVLTYTCRRCGETKTEPIPMLVHDCPCIAFTDMPEFGTVEHDAIDWAFTHDPQITNGTSETTFSPGKTVTRGQAVTFLWRAAGCPEPTNTTHPFTDVKETAYYYKAMLWAVEQGITNGTSETTFSPNKTCTIEQILTFIYRYMGEPEVKTTENPWTDVKDGSFSFKAIMWAVENGIAAPKSETEFGRKLDCTRAAIVTFLYRIMTGNGLVNQD